MKQHSEQIIINQAVHLNKPQLEALIVNANITVVEAGRGTGKSSGIIAPRVNHLARVMPRSTTFLAGPSYRKIIDDLWPNIKKGLNNIGLSEFDDDNPEGDYTFLKKPPANFKKSIQNSNSFRHLITFANGFTLRLISFDYGSTSNGQDNDAGIIDEAKLMNPERIEAELIPTLRGNNMIFGNLPEYQSMLYLSDKYIDKKQFNYLNDFKAKALKEHEIVDIIIKQYALNEALKNNEHDLAKIILDELNEIRLNSIHYLEAKTIDNIHALGWRYIENQYKNLSAHKFLTSIDNQTIRTSEGDRFYDQFTEESHTYGGATNYDKMESVLEDSFYNFDQYTSNRNSLMDNDCVINLPLKLKIDFGARYNFGLIDQVQANMRLTLKEIIVESPKKSKDLVQEFCNYYRFHKNRDLDFYYDISANKEDSRSVELEADELVQILRDNGWNVTNKCEGLMKYPSHRIKYKFWQKMLDNSSGRDDRFTMYKINKDNCPFLIISIGKALKKYKTNKQDFEKDKDDEKKIHTIDQRTTTHLSDANDWCILDYIEYFEEDNPFNVIMH